MNFLKKHIFTLLVLITFVSCSQQKMNGVSLVSPPKFSEAYSLNGVKQINANWVAIIPFAFCKNNSPNVYYNHNHQWWGEKKEGVEGLVNLARKEELKVFLKPHVWSRGGWIGDFSLETVDDWVIWEKDYTEYILAYAKVAADQKIEMFCVGTELKQVVLKRPLFFKKLISQVREVYKGKLTYAANWDNVETVNFWKDLDYIGVDAYYSLSEQKQPSVKELNKAWTPIIQNLETLSKVNKRPVLFTEYGFESSDYNTKETWGSKGKYAINEQAQVNAYQSLYESFYKESWFAGGFLWKWHLTERTMRNKLKTFTPQDKEVEKVIKKQFKKHQ